MKQAVDEAGRRWGAWADSRSGRLSDLVAEEWRVPCDGADGPIEELAPSQIVDSTRARDESIWACRLEPVLGAIPLAKLRRFDIAARVVDLVDDDLASSTVTRCLSASKKALTDAVAEELITAGPAVGVKPPRADQKLAVGS